MWKSRAMSSLVGRFARPGYATVRSLKFSYSTTVLPQISKRKGVSIPEDQLDRPSVSQTSDQNAGVTRKHQIGDYVSRKDKVNFLVNTLLDLKDNKEDVYGALDAWVAWEHNFPIASLKIALLALEKEQQWHRVIQVIKWMLSKGQGNTMGTYSQLIRALDMDQRAEEAHVIWTKKIGSDLHSVPWQLCRLMISVYYRNNMLENLIKLFRGLEAFDRKPPEKSIVRKVADAYEMLGMAEDKERVLQKYNYLFVATEKGCSNKSKHAVLRRSGSKNLRGPVCLNKELAVQDCDGSAKGQTKHLLNPEETSIKEAVSSSQ